MPRIEVLINWDPDNGGTLTMFVDGVETTDYYEEWVDPGRGYESQDWHENLENSLTAPGLTTQFRDRVVWDQIEAFDSQYVDDRDSPEAYELARDEGEEPDYKFRCGYWRGPIADTTDDDHFTMLTSSRQANDALAGVLRRRGFNVHLECWEPDTDQGPLNRGWGLYGHLTD